MSSHVSAAALDSEHLHRGVPAQLPILYDAARALWHAARALHQSSVRGAQHHQDAVCIDNRNTCASVCVCLTPSCCHPSVIGVLVKWMQLYPRDFINTSPSSRKLLEQTNSFIDKIVFHDNEQASILLKRVFNRLVRAREPSQSTCCSLSLSRVIDTNANVGYWAPNARSESRTLPRAVCSQDAIQHLGPVELGV